MLRRSCPEKRTPDGRDRRTAKATQWLAESFVRVRIRNYFRVSGWHKTFASIRVMSCWGLGEADVRTFVAVLSGLVLLLVAVGHAYLAYTGATITIDHVPHMAHAIVVPMLARWICAGVMAVLGILLLALRK